MSMYEEAVRKKLRFKYKGLASVEDLWDLDLVDLNEIYKSLNASKTKASEDSLLETRSAEDVALNTKIEIVKHIFQTKQEEKKARLLEVDRKEKKAKIMEIIARKQDSALEQKSAEELQEMLGLL